MARPDGVDQHAAENLAARAGRRAGHRPRSSRCCRKRRRSSASIRWRYAGSTRRPAKRRSVPRCPTASRRTSPARSSRKRSTRAATLFQWEAKKAASSGKKQGHLARGIGVAVSPYSGGSIGFDGLFIIKPDGRITFQSGIGNHGTHSVFDVHRQAAEMLGVAWEQCDVNFGSTAKNLPWTCISAGSQTAHAMTRAAHAAATDAIKKLQEIAAKAHGGNPDAYKVAGGKVSGPGGSMTLRAGGAKGDRVRRQVRRPRAAGGHQQLHQDVGEEPGRPGTDGGRQGRLSARRPVAVLRRRLRGSRSRHRDRRRQSRRLHRDRATSAPCSTRAASKGSCSADRCSVSATPRPSAGPTTSTTASRWRAASIRTSRRRFSTRRRPSTRRRSACPIRKRPPACAASASRRSARPTARS